MIIIEHIYTMTSVDSGFEKGTEFRAFTDNDTIGVQHYLDSISSGRVKFHKL